MLGLFESPDKSALGQGRFCGRELHHDFQRCLQGRPWLQSPVNEVRSRLPVRHHQIAPTIQRHCGQSALPKCLHADQNTRSLRRHRYVYPRHPRITQASHHRHTPSLQSVAAPFPGVFRSNPPERAGSALRRPIFLVPFHRRVSEDTPGV